VLLLALLPVLMLGGAGLTRLAAPMLSHVHRTVRLADRIWLEEHQQVTGKTDESDAFATLGLESSDLYRDAAAVRAQYEKGAWFLGAWIGLVFGLRMIGLSIRRKRTEYQIDTGSCVACGRCYQSCPVHHAGGLPEGFEIAEGAR
jgi:ferredoxin